MASSTLPETGAAAAHGSGPLQFLRGVSLTRQPRSRRSRAASSSSSSRLLPLSPPPQETQGMYTLAAVAESEAIARMTDDRKRCVHGEADKTPQWRKGPEGPSTLCNACGMRYRSGLLVPNYRPMASPTFVPSEHSNSCRGVLEVPIPAAESKAKAPPPQSARKKDGRWCMHCETQKTPQWREGSETLCQACGVRYRLGCLVPKYRPLVTTPMEPPVGRKRCLHCETDETPQWRSGPEGPSTLCNACGMRHRAGLLVQEYRPVDSPTFESSKHSNSRHRVIKIRRQKELRRRNEVTQQQQMLTNDALAPIPCGSSNVQYLLV